MALTRGGHRLLRGLAFAGVAATGYAFGITSEPVAAQPARGGAPPATLPPAMQPGVPIARPGVPAHPQGEIDRRIVAYITNNNNLVPITREELGDFLIARGGADKLDLLVNKKIIEVEAAHRGISVTPDEIRVGLAEDLKGLGISEADFKKHMLPRAGKTMYEWTEDVIRPRLILTKMCAARVKVTEDDMKQLFENKFGEKRQARVICWAKEDLRAAQAQWAEARKSDEEFIRIAKTQADPALAAAAGLVAPVGRYTDAADKKIENMLFTLKVGEMSELFEVSAGIMCIKLTAIIPAEKREFDDKLKQALYKEVADRRLSQEIPKCFKELKDHAKPQLILKGPSEAENREGVRQITDKALQPTGGVPGAPMAKP